jgi:hypothetical protein
MDRPEAQSPEWALVFRTCTCANNMPTPGAPPQEVDLFVIGTNPMFRTSCCEAPECEVLEVHDARLSACTVSEIHSMWSRCARNVLALVNSIAASHPQFPIAKHTQTIDRVFRTFVNCPEYTDVERHGTCNRLGVVLTNLATTDCSTKRAHGRRYGTSGKQFLIKAKDGSVQLKRVFATLYTPGAENHVLSDTDDPPTPSAAEHTVLVTNGGVYKVERRPT